MIVGLGFITIVAVITVYRLRKREDARLRKQMVDDRRSEQVKKEQKERELRDRQRSRRERVKTKGSLEFHMCSCGARVADGEVCEYCGKKVSK